MVISWLIENDRTAVKIELNVNILFIVFLVDLSDRNWMEMYKRVWKRCRMLIIKKRIDDLLQNVNKAIYLSSFGNINLVLHLKANYFLEKIQVKLVGTGRFRSVPNHIFDSRSSFMGQNLKLNYETLKLFSLKSEDGFHIRKV